MKEFMLKHPFISLLIIDEVCILITNVVQTVVTGSHNGKYVLEEALENTVEGIGMGAKYAREKMNEKEAKKEKLEMGFR